MLETFSLPTMADLKLICKSLAALDLIFVEEQYSLIRKFHYETNWRKGKEAFFYSDGYEQAMMIIFAKEDCVINGCDSELYDYESDNSKLTELIANMPKALQKLMAGKEIKRMKSTFLLWAEANTINDTNTGKDDQLWHYHLWLEHDGALDMLPLLHPSLRGMQEHAVWLGYKLPDSFLEQLVGKQIINQKELILLDVKLELSTQQQLHLQELGFTLI